MKKHRLKRLEIREYYDGFQYKEFFLDDSDIESIGGLKFEEMKTRVLAWLYKSELDQLK